MKLLPACIVSLGLPFSMLQAAPETEPDLKDPSWKMVPLHNGPNTIDVNSDGRDDLVVVARRQNYNAHGFDATTIYIWAPASPVTGEMKESLQIVPIEPAPANKRQDGNLLVLKTAGGADALLHDFRLFVDARHHLAVLITADRKYGDNFGDTQPVTFEYFKLTRNEEGIPGWAMFYFKSYRRVKSKKPHQDVNEAFKAELNIGSDGRDKTEDDK